MNAAKMLVWVMSGMLLALLAILVIGLSLGWHKNDNSVTQSASLISGRAFDLVDLRQPSGTSVADVTEIQGWIAVTLAGGGVPDRVVLINPESGEIVGEIAVNSGGARPSSLRRNLFSQRLKEN